MNSQPFPFGRYCCFWAVHCKSQKVYKCCLPKTGVFFCHVCNAHVGYPIFHIVYTLLISGLFSKNIKRLSNIAIGNDYIYENVFQVFTVNVTSIIFEILVFFVQNCDGSFWNTATKKKTFSKLFLWMFISYCIIVCYTISLYDCKCSIYWEISNILGRT